MKHPLTLEQRKIDVFTSFHVLNRLLSNLWRKEADVVNFQYEIYFELAASMAVFFKFPENFVH